MKISIAMTTYRGESYISEQLGSLLNQTRRPDEVVILDDRSPDGTARLVEDFISSHGLDNWRFSVNEENLGFIRNFHRALSEVSGDIIFLCDQDDIWHADKLEKIERIFEADPSVLAVNTSFELIDGDGARLPVFNKKGWYNNNLIYGKAEADELIEIPFAEIIRSNISPGCTMAVHRDLKDFYLEKATLRIPHDYEMNIYAADLGRLMFLNSPLISYRIHASNTIGLSGASDDESAVRFSGDRKKRFEVLEHMKALSELLRERYLTDERAAEYIGEFIGFTEKKRLCLEERRLGAWFGMWKHYRHVRPYVRLRQYFGDLIYLMGLQRFFEKK